MEISLRPFTRDDIHSVEQWAKDIDAGQYQSRIFPRAFNGRDLSGLSASCAWYIILADGQDAGTVWLEKEKPEDEAAILGIMLGKKDMFGKGIGREAVQQAIKQARDTLDYRRIVLTVRRNNTRAIASYQRVGFTITNKGIREYEDGRRIPYYLMELKLQAQA